MTNLKFVYLVKLLQKYENIGNFQGELKLNN